MRARRASTSAARGSDKGSDPNIRGALNILINGLCMVIGTAMIKHVAAMVPEMVVILARHLVAVACFAPILWSRGIRDMRPRNPGAHFWRAVFGLGGFSAFTYSVTHLPLSDAVAIAFTQPIWSTLLGAVVFRERLGSLQVLAVLGGFAGVLLMLKPAGSFEPMMLVGLAGALLTSIAMALVKRLSSNEPPEQIAFWFLVAATCLTIVPAASTWTSLPRSTLPWLLGIGILAGVGQLALTRGYQLGRFSTMAMVDFARLPMSVAVGLVVFQEMPDLLSALGMGIIAAASLLVIQVQRGASTVAATGAGERKD